MISFEKLGLTPAVLQAVNEVGYIIPTPIQSKVIPLILMGEDLLAIAQTGTGKTASFILPLIDILSAGSPKARMPRALILAPTRELALQIQENLAIYSKYNNLSWTTLIGGESMVQQEKSLEKNNDIIIATPGRFLDLKQRGKFLMNNIKMVIIDEADRMLDMGFLPDINTILAALPAQRQTLLFSATLPDSIKQLTKNYLPRYKEVFMAPESSISQNIDQHFLGVSSDKKSLILKDVLQENPGTTLIFCNRKIDIEKLKNFLTSFSIKVEALHGDMTQSARLRALEDFKKGNISILIASDVAARGIDIDSLGLVINYDLPLQSEDYVHRIGRTGRAGNLGKSISFVTAKDKNIIKDLEKILKRPIEIIKKKENTSSVDSEKNSHRAAKKLSSGEKNNPPQEDVSVKPSSTKNNSKKEQMSTSNLTISSEESSKQKSIKKLQTPSYLDISSKTIIGFGDHLPAFLNKPAKNSINNKSSL